MDHHSSEPFSASSQRPHPPLSPNAASGSCEHTYNEKDAYLPEPVPPAGGSKSSYGRGRDSVISPFSPKPSHPPSPTSSVSSAGSRRHHTRPEIHHAAPSKERNLQYPPQAHLDPEKHASAHSHPLSPRDSATAAHASTNAVVHDQGEYHEKAVEEKAWQLLFYLSGPCAMLSTAITLWTFGALFVSLLLAPLKFCTTRPSLSTQLTTFLVPALNLQLHLVYSHNASTDYSAPMLVVIHLFSPVVAFGVAIAAWTAAGFWFFSSILGDPGGHDGHNDGKESILGVRSWWERWLSRALR